MELNPYSTKYVVWADKTGRLPPKEETEAMRVGTDLEFYVAERFAEKSGKKVRRSPYMWGNTEYPFAAVNIDREIVGENAFLECKTTSVLNLSNFKGGEFPWNYYVQVVHGLAVTEAERAYVAALILGVGFQIYQLTRNADDTCPEWCESSVYVSDAEITALMDAERDFWENVKNDTPPELSGQQADSDALSAIYAGGSKAITNLMGFTGTLERREALKERIKDLETELSACEQEIKQAMGDSELGRASGYSVIWKTQARSSFDVKAFTKDNPDVDLSGYYKVSRYRKFTVQALAE